MIIHDLDIDRIAVLEFEAQSPLTIDADTMPTGAISFERLKTVRRRQTQIFEPICRVQLQQPHRRPLQNVLRKPARLAGGKETLRFGIGKRSNHAQL